MNKLVYGYRKILRSLLDSLLRVDDTDSCRRVNELEAELEYLQKQKDILIKMMSGNLLKIEEISRLLRFVSKSEMPTVFDSGLLEKYVNRIIVYFRIEVEFELK